MHGEKKKAKPITRQKSLPKKRKRITLQTLKNKQTRHPGAIISAKSEIRRKKRRKKNQEARKPNTAFRRSNPSIGREGSRQIRPPAKVLSERRAKNHRRKRKANATWKKVNQRKTAVRKSSNTEA